MMRAMRRSALPPLVTASLLLGACASEPAEPAQAQQGIPTHVELLDAHRVRFSKQEVPLESFLYEVRTRVRAASGKPEQQPVVTIVVAEGAGPETMRALDRIVRQLHASGVHRINLGGG